MTRWSMAPWSAVIGAFAALAPSVAAAGTIEGRVFIDLDRDGLLSVGESTLPRVTVVWETSVFATTGADGRYSIVAPDVPGIIWIRVPDGFRPSPVWAQVAAAGGSFDLPLVPEPAGVGDTFAVASDLHLGKEELGTTAHLDAAAATAALSQAAALVPPPRFIALTGDLVEANEPVQYAMLERAVDSLDVPVVPVPGNHDWYDGGASYRAALGPPMYSFDSGPVHFVVLNDNLPADAWTAFLVRDLAAYPDSVPVVAFAHRPPDDPELDALEDSGVDLLFTGHWHSNMVLRHGHLLQLNTEPMIRGGIDGTPAGFRVVTVGADSIGTEHRVVVDRPVLQVVAPAIDECVAGERAQLIVAAEAAPRIDEVRATVGSRTVPLSPAGAWSWSGEIRIGSAIPQLVRVEVTSGDGAVATLYHPVARCDVAPSPAAGEWIQTQGGPEHLGARDRVIAPPLATRWTRAVHAHPTAPPVIADGRVYVSLADLDDGSQGGVVALDLATGDEAWRFAPGADVRNATAVARGIAVIAAADGTVHAVDAATGTPLWRRDLGEALPANTRVLHAAPTIAGDTVYIGVQRNFVALDLVTGQTRWSADPAPGNTTLTTRAAAAVAGDMVVGTVARGRNGVFAWDAATGAERWRLSPDDSLGVQASPMIAGDSVYIANSQAEVIALDVTDGSERWRTQVVEGAENWDYAVLASAAYARNRLFVPTQYDDLVALDATTGAELWRVSALDSLVHDAHARSRSRSFPSPPVVTGDLIWILGGDGRLRALDPDTGGERWAVDLGVPGNAGIAPAGDTLVIATFDGTVRAMATVPEPAPGVGARKTGVRVAGACAAGVAALALVALWVRRSAARGSRPR